jgi:hypothetical protein
MPRKYVVREGSQILLSPHHPASAPPPVPLAPAVGVEGDAVSQVELFARVPPDLEHPERVTGRLFPGAADPLTRPGALVLEGAKRPTETGGLTIHDVPTVETLKRRDRRQKNGSENPVALDWDNIRIESDLDDDVGESGVTLGDDSGFLPPVLPNRDSPKHEPKDVGIQHEEPATVVQPACQAPDHYVEDRSGSEESILITMQVAITVPQDQLQAAVRAEVGAIFAGLLGGKVPASAAPRAARAKAAEAAPAPAAPARKARTQPTAAPKAAEVAKPSKGAKTGGVQEGTNAATVLAAVKQGLSRADDIAEKTKLDKGQVNAALAVLKRNELIAAVARGQYKAN